MRILGIITARGGSKGIPGKNIKPLFGKPLIWYTIDAAQKSGVFNQANGGTGRLILSTDDEKIAEVAKKCGVEVPFARPSELAEDKTPTLPVIHHAVNFLKEKEGYEPDYIMILQPTSPLRQPFHIKEAVDLILKTGADSVVSVSEVPRHFNPHWQFNLMMDDRLKIFTGEPFREIVAQRQGLGATYFKNGAVFLFKTKLLTEGKPSLYGDDVRGYVMDEKYNINIDTLGDWDDAEKKLKNLMKQ